MSSYWEKKSFWENIDFGIVGSGIVGLFAALRLKELFPESRVAVFERGALPSGASTRNAGFSCIGSLSELLDDLEALSEAEMLQLVRNRAAGLQKLRATLGDSRIGYADTGNFELFRKEDTALYEKCIAALPRFNALLHPVTGLKETFSLMRTPDLETLPGAALGIKNNFEGVLDTGKMMFELIQKSRKAGIEIYNGMKTESFEENTNGVRVLTEDKTEIAVKYLLFCTNAFAKNREVAAEIQPFRNQVFIYHMANHKIPAGGYHFDKGYVYFRPLDEDRILIGGGRNIDPTTESTSDFGQTEKIENYLKNLLENLMAAKLGSPVMKWSGILASGPKKLPIVKMLSQRTGIAVRLGGMGVAIGSLTGTHAAELFASVDTTKKD